MKIAILLKKLAKISRTSIAAFASKLLSATLWFFMLMFGGASMLMYGINILAGFGWALISGGMMCILVAMMLLRGMARV